MSVTMEKTKLPPTALATLTTANSQDSKVKHQKEKMPLPQAITGFINYRPADHRIVTLWKNTLQEVYNSYGFTQLHVPTFVNLPHLMKGGIGKQVYAIYRAADAEKGSESFTRYGLPYDRTVPFALYIAQNVNKLFFPFRRSDISLSYRGEKAQAGRFRGFIQADIDIAGRNLNLSADTDCIMTMITALRKLEIGNFVVSMNHMTIAKALVNTLDITTPEKEAAILRAVDKLDKLPKEGVVKLVQEELPEENSKKIEELIDLFSYRGPLERFPFSSISSTSPAVTKASDEINRVLALLRAQNVPSEMLCFCPGMVRGLDYYTGIVFETHLIGKERFGSIASGGRYDNLVGDFDPRYRDIQGVGASIGFTRLYDILISRNSAVTLTRSSVSDFFVAFQEPQGETEAVRIAGLLRERGCRAESNVIPGNLRKQLRHAKNIGIGNVIIVLRDGLAYKNMNIPHFQQLNFANDQTEILITQAIASHEAYQKEDHEMTLLRSQIQGEIRAQEKEKQLPFLHNHH